MAILPPRDQREVLAVPAMQFQVERDGRTPATRLSRQIRDMREISDVFGLARRSLCLVAIMFFSQSCIVADPPEYRSPQQTRPVLNMYSAVPPAIHALVLSSAVLNNPPTSFTVQVRSEDAGEDLRALFFLDYQLPGQRKLAGQQISASTYLDTGRDIRFVWSPDKKDAGCHFVSFVVAHTESFLKDTEDKLDPKKADEDAAIATWTVSVDPPNSLENCPSPITSP